MIIKNHWLDPSTKVLSPNFDERPEEEDISLIVIHCISLPPNQFGGAYISQLFCNQLDPAEHNYFEEIHELKVSAHLLIKRNGEVIQFVPFNKRAWHAGTSSYKDRHRCNDYSIGIELEGTELIEYSDKQYKKLILIIKTLLNQYPELCEKRIVGHCNIAPERKTDPGKSFDWTKLTAALQS